VEVNEMAAKKCLACGRAKPMEAFGRDSKMRDGHLTKCRTCWNAVQRKYRREHRRECLLWKKRWKLKYRKEHRQWKAKYRLAHPGLNTIYVRVWRALRTGELARANQCEVCSAPGPLHAHHDDYERPLDVRWLCPSCHELYHVAKYKGDDKMTKKHVLDEQVDDELAESDESPEGDGDGAGRKLKPSLTVKAFKKRMDDLPKPIYKTWAEIELGKQGVLPGVSAPAPKATAETAESEKKSRRMAAH